MNFLKNCDSWTWYSLYCFLWKLVYWLLRISSLYSKIDWFLDSKIGIKIAWRNINNLRYADDTCLLAESEEELKSLLMKVKEEGESCLKSQYSKNEDHGIIHHFMANWWGNNGNSDRLYFLGLQNHYRWWLQPWN